MAKEKMTWEERREMHLQLWEEYSKAARESLRAYINSHDWADYQRHCEEYKLSNKHWGIAEAMWTRKYGHI